MALPAALVHQLAPRGRCRQGTAGRARCRGESHAWNARDPCLCLHASNIAAVPPARQIEGRGNGIKTNVVNNAEIAKALERPPDCEALAALPSFVPMQRLPIAALQWC